MGSPAPLVGSRDVTMLAELPLIASGKVREMYELSGAEATLLMVASDRISTYDAVHPTPIPDKGTVLTGLSAFWFEQTAGIVRNHLVSATEGVPAQVRGRALAVRRLRMLPVECVVRGYITGSAWKDYQASGSVSGIALPEGLRESEQLPEPIFTPSTKAETGHDQNISFEEMLKTTGPELGAELRQRSIDIYTKAAQHAQSRGIILADTKFEWGRADDGKLLLIDEVLTPDSSRFWPADQYRTGSNPPSFDKQFVRDWLESAGWDKNSPPPELPADVVERTREKYLEAFERLTARKN